MTVKKKHIFREINFQAIAAFTGHKTHLDDSVNTGLDLG